jgi:hypothetical protein
VKSLVLIAAMGLLLSGCAGGLDLSAGDDVPLRAIGHASVAVQPGRTPVQRQLMAMQAARLVAMRELAEKIYGARVGGQSSVMEGRIAANVVRSDVEGLVRGARVSSLSPIKPDVYEAIVEIDAREAAALRRLGPPVYR